MTDFPIINDIDFAALYRNHIQLATREPKTAQDWDSKAENLLTQGADFQDDYSRAFVTKMALKPSDSLLDIGCGGGAIGLSVAPTIQQVYALDFSPKMLQVVQQRAQQLGINNLQPLLKSWYDNWDEVPECDVCVSSRSSMVDDLEAALNKLNAKAKRAVYMTMTVEKDFIAQDVLRHIGRDSVGFPSYIYALNILHQQGYRVSVGFIRPQAGMSRVSEWNEEAFIRSVAWSLGQLSEQEIQKLKAYFAQQQPAQARPNEKVWAFLSWEK